MGSLLSSPIWESLATSIIQELFLLAKESRDQQIKQYSAWAISFLREKWWSKELQNINSQVGSTYPNVSSQNFAEDSLVMKLCLWLGDVDVTKVNSKLIHLLHSFVCDVCTFYYHMHNCLHAYVCICMCMHKFDCSLEYHICCGTCHFVACNSYLLFSTLFIAIIFTSYIC